MEDKIAKSAFLSSLAEKGPEKFVVTQNRTRVTQVYCFPIELENCIGQRRPPDALKCGIVED